MVATRLCCAWALLVALVGVEAALGQPPQAGKYSSADYKVIEARYPGKSTALVTNVDFESWSDYLGDPPLAMAFLDRVVDGAIILKIEGESYRAHRARRVGGDEPIRDDSDQPK